MLTYQTVSLDDARRIIDAGIAKAEEIDSPSNIAVVDTGGNLVAHVRMDGSQLGSIEHSIDKARTSMFFRKPTGDLAEDSRPGGPLWGIALSGYGTVIVFAGGLPLAVDGRIVGAIGVSGGTGEEDTVIARAAVARL
ncbi:heme-binding protein [Streptomyces sp. AM 4-1-1]|uniref:GlcG/HbpS family heme-binding protein n=1 Tax=Streptomyces sp. AM 4-1-1 TaxID=3028710 RepID=UPI0023B9E459|nr:heme-binding protein [Streptomyces sp. AM 4-1-1]WEH36492.1 heme-binding protein [Streptomyces sp. AM 4-1-1]